MYALRRASDVSKPLKPVMLGYPEHTYPDLVFVTDGVGEPMQMNSMILRQALLANPALTKELIGVEVSDAKAKKVTPAPKPVPTEVKKEAPVPKKETKTEPSKEEPVVWK